MSEEWSAGEYLFVSDALQCTESSEGVRSLMDKMVESRIQSLGLRRGSPESAKELGMVTGLLRRRLSSAVMRANVRCLLERLVLVGEGQGQAMGKGRGRERPAGERSPVAGQDNREKLGQNGRFPLVVIFSCPCNNFMLNSNGLNIKFPLQLINFLTRT